MEENTKLIIIIPSRKKEIKLVPAFYGTHCIFKNKFINQHENKFLNLMNKTNKQTR